MKASDEVEAKFDIDPGTPLPALAEVAPGVETVELPPLRLTASYYDTPGLRLLRRGATLRRRRSPGPGGENLWTLKLPGTSAGAAYARKEISWPGDPGGIPGRAAELVSGIAMGENLSEVAVLVSDRRRLQLRSAEGGCLAEVDDDTVTVRRPHRIVFRQVEVELVDGDAKFLSLVADRLRRGGVERGTDEPKVSRALRGEASDPERSPLPAGPPGDPTLAAVVRASLASGLDRLLDNEPGVRLDDDPEFVHQARVATRRLRSDLKTWGRFLDEAWVERTRRELAWLGGALGELRDADVLSERLHGYADTADPSDSGGFEELLRRLATRRAAAVTDLAAVMRSTRYTELLRSVEAASSNPPLAAGVDPSAPASKCLAPLVDSAWRRTRRKVKALGEPACAPELHQVRIRAKQLRYAAEATEGIFGGRASRLARAAAQVQTLLGDHQDAVASELWARVAAGQVGPAGILAAGEVVALERTEQARARKRWPGAWKRLRRAGRRARRLDG